MKKLCFIALFISLFTSLFAAPFGLKMGMTIKEITNECSQKPIYFEDDIYSITPVKKHPFFTTYAARVNEKTGLYEILAFSDYIACNNYGTQIRNAFEDIKDRISKTYGTPTLYDIIDPDSYFKEEKYWLSALKDGDRALAAEWGEKSELADNLDYVSLKCIPNSDPHSNDALLSLTYWFNNADSVQDEQDSVF